MGNVASVGLLDSTAVICNLMTGAVGLVTTVGVGSGDYLVEETGLTDTTVMVGAADAAAEDEVDVAWAAK